MKSTQTPIEHIVSSSDIEMFQQAKEKAAEVMVRTSFKILSSKTLKFDFSKFIFNYKRPKIINIL